MLLPQFDWGDQPRNRPTVLAATQDADEPSVSPIFLSASNGGPVPADQPTREKCTRRPERTPTVLRLRPDGSTVNDARTHLWISCSTLLLRSLRAVSKGRSTCSRQPTRSRRRK